jgi:OOP family OmpA-OmpF porin
MRMDQNIVPKSYGSCGYSRGEDAVWGPEEWKTNPKSMKGGTLISVVRDGDWNIAVHYASDNGVQGES